MASRFMTFSKDRIRAMNYEAIVQSNTRKVTNFDLSLFTGR